MSADNRLITILAAVMLIFLAGVLYSCDKTDVVKETDAAEISVESEKETEESAEAAAESDNHVDDQDDTQETEENKIIPENARDCYRGIVERWLTPEELRDEYSNIITSDVMKMISKILDDYKNGINPLLSFPDPKTYYVIYPVSEIRTYPDFTEVKSMIESAEITDETELTLKLELGDGWVMRLPLRFGQFGESYDAYFKGIYFDKTDSEDDEIIDLYLSGEDVTLPEGYASSVDDYETIDLTPGSYEEGLLNYVRALLENDTDMLERMCGNAMGNYNDTSNGIYRDIYAGNVFGRYVLKLEKDFYSNYKLFFYVNIIESSIRRFSPGIHRFYVQDGMFGYILEDVNPETREYTGAAFEVIKLLNNMYFQEIPRSDDMPYDYRWCLTDYICGCLGGEGTAEDVSGYAKTYFGIDGFTPDKLHDNDGDGVYNILAHGGIHQEGRITDVTEKDGYTEVTVQYYADYNHTVESDVYVYRLIEIDGRWAYTGCEKISEGKYKPFVWSV